MRIGTVTGDKIAGQTITPRELAEAIWRMDGEISYTYDGEQRTLALDADKPEILMDAISARFVEDLTGASINLTLMYDTTIVSFTDSRFTHTVTYPAGITGAFDDTTGNLLIESVEDHLVEGSITLSITHTDAGETAMFLVPFRKRTLPARHWQFWYVTNTETAWSDALATAATGGNVYGDIVTMNGDGFVESRRWDGSAWDPVEAAIAGTLLVDGAILGRHLEVRTLNAQHIVADSLTANEIKRSGVVGESVELGAITAREIADQSIELRHLSDAVLNEFATRPVPGGDEGSLTKSMGEHRVAKIDDYTATANTRVTATYDALVWSGSVPRTRTNSGTTGSYSSRTVTRTVHRGGNRGGSFTRTVTQYRRWEYKWETWTTPAVTLTITWKLKITGLADITRTQSLNIAATSLTVRGATAYGSWRSSRGDDAIAFPAPSPGAATVSGSVAGASFEATPGQGEKKLIELTATLNTGDRTVTVRGSLSTREVSSS